MRKSQFTSLNFVTNNIFGRFLILGRRMLWTFVVKSFKHIGENTVAMHKTKILRKVSNSSCRTFAAEAAKELAIL